MLDFSDFYQIIAKNRLSHWLRVLPEQLHHWQQQHAHGDFPRWARIVNKFHPPQTAHRDFLSSVTLGQAGEMSDGERQKTENLLKHLSPWRKGPFFVHGIHIDTEWRSDWKWDRLIDHISPLKDRYVLDVGCGSGYHMWRMLGQGAEFVVGIDPSTLFLCQFEAIRRFANNEQAVHLLPLGIEQLPELKAFDTVFSMGVLYHRRSPFDHLIQLKNQLRVGGELVLETLIVDGDENTVLVPMGRYGKMPNVWCLPSPAALCLWLEKIGFTEVKVVDIAPTTLEEQRSTEWMQFESLNTFLDGNDPSRTVEGLPAPKRAVFIAKNPG